MNIFIYIRVSTEEQALHGLSLGNQEDALISWAKNNNHNILGIYRDEGVSARKPYTKRPAIMQMIRDLPTKSPDLICFTKLDRWFRNIREYYKVQEILDAASCGWKAIWEDYDTTTASGRLHINIMLSISQDEADRTSERIKAVQASQIAAGAPITGNPPVGYKIATIDGKKRLVKDPERGKMLRAIVDHYFLTSSLIDTTKYCNATFGTRYQMRSIRQIFTNKILIGYYRGNPNYVEPYLTEAEFNRLQALINRHKRDPSPKAHAYLFSGLLRCPVCGYRLSGTRTRAYYYYICMKHKDGLCKFNRSVSELQIEKFLANNIQSFFDAELIAWKSRKLKKAAPRPEYFAAQLDRLNEMYLLGNIPKEKYESKSSEIKLKLAESKTKASVKADGMERIKKILSDDFPNVYAALDQNHRRMLWHGVLREIKINENREVVGVDFLL